MPEITYDRAVTLTPRVRRLTAENPGRMTGPGTNTYLIGHDEIAVVDPGPALDRHVDTLLRTCGDRLRWIFVTHTHRDHSPAAQPLAEASGAELVGNIIANDGFQDDTFRGARGLAHDERLHTEEFTLRAVLSPGHVANHVCYLVDEDKLLVTGDHIMGGSTVVIIPPAGDMKDYIESLRRMLRYDLAYLAPGHGDLIANPHAEIKYLIAHRLKREQKVIAALQSCGPCPISVLTPVVYDDVDAALHGAAAMSLHAHLLKLEREGLAKQAHDHWRMAT